MVNTVRITKALRETVDAYVLQNPRREHGGFLFGSPTEFVSFLPAPNISPTLQSSYKPPEGWKMWADTFAAVVGFPLVGHVHTHPNHSIPSANDVKAGGYWHNVCAYMVLIAPNVEGNRTTWWVLDSHYEVQELTETDAQLEQASLLLARRFGLVNLGQVLMDANGKLLLEGGISQVLVASEDARQLYAALLTKNGSLKTRKDIQAMSPIPQGRTLKALDVLVAVGLVQSDNWRGYQVQSIFGRKLG